MIVVEFVSMIKTRREERCRTKYPPYKFPTAFYAAKSRSAM